MGEKSTRKEGGKTAPAKTLEEERTAGGQERRDTRVANTDAVTRVRASRSTLSPHPRGIPRIVADAGPSEKGMPSPFVLSILAGC